MRWEVHSVHYEGGGAPKTRKLAAYPALRDAVHHACVIGGRCVVWDLKLRRIALDVGSLLISGDSMAAVAQARRYRRG